MQDKQLYVIMFNTGTYWCGLNTVSSQLRKANVFTSVKKAMEAGERALANYKHVNIVDTTDHTCATSFKLCIVEMKVVGVLT